MDFEDTPGEAEFRQQVRAFLAQHAPAGQEVRYTRAHPDAQMVERARAWQGTKADHGYAGLNLPRRWGGREATPMEQIIYNQEERRYDVPRGVYDVTLGMCIPTMLAYASPADLERYVRPALRGEEIWCQLFSEPGAGSDLAGLRTRAQRHGDGWLINGQKVWTSRAHLADFGLLLTRTDSGVAKHKGLTAFFIDMKTPGVEVRPIRLLTGDHNFNEVFLTDVVVPDAQRLGAVGEGWKVALTTLSHERLAISELIGPTVKDLFQLCATTEVGGVPLLDDPVVRHRLAEMIVRSEGVRYTRYRTLTAISRGATPGPEASVAKAVNGQRLQEIADFGLDLLGQAGAVMDEDGTPMSGWFQQAFLYAPPKRVAGGTDEILRNVIAERVLGLPPDQRADKNMPFDQIPSFRGTAG